MENNTTIGQLLKEARQKKNMSLDDIINKTKININVLKHLENDALSELPSRPYVKGFVANYAKVVGLNSELAKDTLEYSYQLHNNKNHFPTKDVPQIESLDAKAKELETAKTSNHNPEEIRETLTSIAKSFFNKKIFYSMIAISLVIGIIQGFKTFFSQLTSESESINSSPPPLIKVPTNFAKNEISDTKINDESIAHNSVVSESVATDSAVKEPILKEAKEDLFDFKATKKLEAAAEIKPAPKTDKMTPLVDKLIDKLNKNLTNSMPPKTPANIEEVKNLPASSEKFPFKEFYPSPTNMYDLIADAPEVNNPDILPPSIKASVIDDKQNVYIVATDDNTWISYKVDDEKIKRYILKKGRSVLIKGNQILLFMGNFNATKVFLNNKLVSADSKTGVKSMIFPEAKAKDFELPLFPSVNGVPYSAKEYKANMQPRSESSIE